MTITARSRIQIPASVDIIFRVVHIESDLRLRLWQAAEDAAVQVFAGNLRDLLLAAPAGGRTTMGLDPGYRTGVKVAVVTETGHVAATTTIYPHEPQRRWDESIAQLARLAREHRVELIAIGNGTASAKPIGSVRSSFSSIPSSS